MKFVLAMHFNCLEDFHPQISFSTAESMDIFFGQNYLILSLKSTKELSNCRPKTYVLSLPNASFRSSSTTTYSQKASQKQDIRTTAEHFYLFFLLVC